MKILIIGASFAGLTAAKTLADSKETHEIVVVDKRNYVDVNFLTPRLLQHPQWTDSLVQRLDSLPWMSKCKLMQATVTELHSKHASLDSGETLEFDHCIISSGGVYSNSYCHGAGTANRTDRLDEIKEHAEKVKAAKSVLIIGGGLTGMEMAAEAKEANPEATVTLVHTAPHLCRSEAQGKTPLARLKKIGVTVVLGARANVAAGDATGKTITIGDAEAATFDEVYWCTGATVKTDFAEPLGPDVRNAKGRIHIEPTFQVKGYPHIFAIGDCADADDIQLGFFAMQHGPICAKNVLKYGKDPSAKLGAWKRNGAVNMQILLMGTKNLILLIGQKSVFTWVPASMGWAKGTNTIANLGMAKMKKP